MKKFIVAGNWKMNHTPQDAEAFLQEFEGAEKPNCEWTLFPPALCWQSVAKSMQGENLNWGLQHVHAQPSGAYTGEISVNMAKEVGCDYVLIGHSERRSIFSETDQEVAQKVEAAQNLNVTPMICVGETLEERESGRTRDVIVGQLREALSKANFAKSFVVAYEPVWAIGTGKVATPEQAEEAHSFLRELLKELGGEELADKTSILYGGSVKPANAKELSAKAEIDGFLIGGASLKAESFVEIGRNSV